MKGPRGTGGTMGRREGIEDEMHKTGKVGTWRTQAESFSGHGAESLQDVGVPAQCGPGDLTVI